MPPPAAKAPVQFQRRRNTSAAAITPQQPPLAMTRQKKPTRLMIFVKDGINC
jgi:hypothetical protein